MQKMTKIYFAQSEHYYSESGDAMVPIADMDPAYAGNAARRLLQDSPTWADEAGVARTQASVWMLSTPLWNALYQRAWAGRARRATASAKTPECPCA